jgi:AbrB family looped-hinge helix DNA binding protein
MVLMNATVEIDKAGRLVVPKKMREALHLRGGDRLALHCAGDSLILEREKKPRGLYEEDGLLVYDSGGPTITAEQTFHLIESMREERMRHILGEDFEE